MFQEMVQQFLLSAMFFLGLLGLSAAVVMIPIVGAWFIRSAVRWTNRRDDPREAKLPPLSH
jgi:hypothetical protein